MVVGNIERFQTKYFDRDCGGLKVGEKEHFGDVPATPRFLWLRTNFEGPRAFYREGVFRLEIQRWIHVRLNCCSKITVK